jgi:hypothetical protein
MIIIDTKCKHCGYMYSEGFHDPLGFKPCTNVSGHEFQ